MKDGAAAAPSTDSRHEPPLRFVSAASLFDGHDAAINMIRRLLQARGAEVVHLGHNRSVADIVRAAIEEDADAIAVSSYQGGHNEYFTYMVDMLRERGYAHIRVVVGGGGTIAPHEIEALERHGVEKIYTPEDGRQLGLAGMIDDVFQRLGAVEKPPYEFRPLNARDHGLIARTHLGARGRSRGRRAPGRADPARAGALAPQGAGHRHHRHRRRRQVEPHRRAAGAPGARTSRRRRSPWWRWTRRAGAAAARCSATASA